MEDLTPSVPGQIEAAVFHAELSGPPQVRRDVPLSFHTLVRNLIPVGSPVEIALALRNRSEVDQLVPKLFLMAPGAPPMLPPGIQLEIAYSSCVPPLLQRFADLEFDYGSFLPVPLLARVSADTTVAAAQTILPGQSKVILQINVQDYADLSRPGTYRIAAILQAQGEPLLRTPEILVSIA